MIVATELSARAELWDIDLNKKINDLSASRYECGLCNRSVYRVEYTKNGQFVAISFGATVLVFETETGTFVNGLIDDGETFYGTEKILTDEDVVLTTRFTPDRKRIATAGKTVKIWDVSNGKLLQTLKGHKFSVTSLAISPDNHLLASGDGGGKIIMWDMESGRLLWTSDSKQEVRRLEFDRDGRRIVSITRSLALFWDSTSASILYRIRSDDPLYTQFSPDWKYVAFPNQKHTKVGLYRLILN